MPSRLIPGLLLLSVVAAPAAAADAAPAGVYAAAEVPGSSKMTAAGMAWWGDRLVIADRGGKRLVAFTPPDRFETLREVPAIPVGLAVDPDGNLVVTEREPPRVVRIKPDGTRSVVADRDVGTPQFVTVHRSGRVFWSGFPDGGTRTVAPGGGAVAVLTPKIGHTYGIGLSPNHDWLYVASKLPDHRSRAVWRFPLDAAGTPGPGEVFFRTADLVPDLPGLPATRDGGTTLLGWVGRLQGLAVDRLGHVYVAGAESHTSGEAVAVVAPDGKRVAAMILGLPRNVSGLAFGGRDGRTLFVTGAGEYRLFQVSLPVAGVFATAPPAAGGSPARTFRGHDKWVRALAFTPDGKRVVSGGQDETVRVWDEASGAELRALRNRGGGVTALTVSPDGRRVAAGNWDGTLTVWNLDTGTDPLTLRGHKENVTAVAFSPDGKRLASGSGDDTLKLWDAAAGHALRTLGTGNEYDVTAVAFSPDGKRLVSGDGEGVLTVWDVATGEELSTLAEHAMAVTAVAFSPDGTRIASGSQDDTARVWNADRGRELLTLRGHTEDVTAVAFSPDAKRVVTGGDDATVRVWDAATGRVRFTLRLPGGVAALAVSPDGRRVVAAVGNALELRSIER